LFKQRDSLVENLNDFVGKELVAQTYHDFVDRLHQELPDGILRCVIHDSVQLLLKQRLSSRQLFEICWRLVANVEELRSVRPVLPWERQKAYEWIPVQICGVETQRKDKELQNVFTFQALAGSVVPQTLVQSWSVKKTNYLAKYRTEKNFGFGFGRSRVNRRGTQLGKGLYLDSRQFYNLRCWLLLDPARSKNVPFAIEVGHTAATTAYNKELITLRDRTQNPCLKGFDLECYVCPFGAKDCVLATHALTYRKQSCTRCKQPEYVDPAELEYPGKCLRCTMELKKL
jgi:hypothetical protein